MTTFEEYDKQAEGTDVSPKTIEYYILGLAGEAGETANEMKKVLRDKEGIMDADSRDKILEEMGDCLWYLSRLANLLHFSTEELAYVNLAKLHKRYNK